MDEEEKTVHLLAPLRPVSEIPMTGDDGQGTDMNGMICGADVNPYLEGTSAAVDEDTALSRFMSGEISYDAFMQIHGGQTLAEEQELADDTGSDDGEDNTLSIDKDEDVQPSTSRQGEMYSAKRERSDNDASNSELPVYVRTMVNEVISDELAPEDGQLPPKARVTTIASTMKEIDSSDKNVSRLLPRKSTKTADALLGQANVLYARGLVSESVQLLLEVIRQNPRDHVPYQQLSDIFAENAQQQNSLQYGLLSAHLNPHTPADVWSKWGDVSTELELKDEAAACYGRAVRLEPTNWMYYEKRINALEKLGLRPFAMRTRLHAAQMIDHKAAGVDFEWLNELIKTVAKYYISINDEDRSILALEAFVLRSKEFGLSADEQHSTLIGMWMAKSKYLEAARSIFALCEDISIVYRSGSEAGRSAIEVEFTNGTYLVKSFPPQEEVEIIVKEKFPTHMLSSLVVCFIRINRRDLATMTKNILMERDLSNSEEMKNTDLLEIARTFYSCDAFKSCKSFLDSLMEFSYFIDNGETWFIYGNALQALKETDSAIEAFERCLELLPNHVDARINLSNLQQKAGHTDKALETLQGYDLDTCTHLPDERLLLRQAEVLSQGHNKEQFVRSVRMLLTPHFYVIHKQPELVSKRRHSKAAYGLSMSNTLRLAALNAIQDSSWEKFVKRLGLVATSEGRSTDDLSPIIMHDMCLKLIEHLDEMERYQDMLVVCSYAFLQPRINKSQKTSSFQNLLYYCATKAESWPLAFEYVRWFLSTTNTQQADMKKMTPDTEVLYKRIFNAMNYVFCHSQNVCYHRYIMRSLAKLPENHALQAISGNNSLITGTYRHALGEYLRVWVQNKRNPLICLLLALTFTHMACKKDLSSRHMIAIRGIAFMKKYERTRTVRQEVYYNIGRMFHQLSILPLAIHFYEKVLSEPPPKVFTQSNDGDFITAEPSKYDLRPFAAHNLALICRSSGNDLLSRQVVRRRINDRLANKIVPDLGLCMCVYDLVEIGPIYILPGEGVGHTRVKFRLVVFRPHIDEVIQARVLSSNQHGLTLTIDFFQDIFIPAENLPKPHKFEALEQVWYWDYSSEEDDASGKLYMDPGKIVRFKVKENIFRDVKPDPEDANKEKSYEIIGAMTEQGLGCVQWWSSVEADDMDAE